LGSQHYQLEPLSSKWHCLCYKDMVRVNISFSGRVLEIKPYHHRRGTASVIKDLAQASAEDPASHLLRLALLFTQRQLDVQKAFADLDEQRNGSITPAQLVCSSLLLCLRCATGHKVLHVLPFKQIRHISGLHHS
jgi:hypothetical protein